MEVLQWLWEGGRKGEREKGREGRQKESEGQREQGEEGSAYSYDK